MNPYCDHVMPNREKRWTCLLCKKPVDFGEHYSCANGGQVVMHNDCMVWLPNKEDLPLWARCLGLLAHTRIWKWYIARFGYPWTTVVDEDQP